MIEGPGRAFHSQIVNQNLTGKPILERRQNRAANTASELALFLCVRNGPLKGWSGRLDSNQRPYGPELITNFARLCLLGIYGNGGTRF